jgi:diguanylate cyclase (GGDEF)-like protein/PAS domain S-box-containing protein
LEQLRQELDFSKTLIETSSAFFVAINPDGKTMMMNQGFLNAIGYSLDEVMGRDYLSTFIPEADREPFTKIFEQLVKLKQPTIKENRVLTKDGRELSVEWRCKATFNKKGELDFVFGVGIDITERRFSEKESARLASIALLSPNPIIETDLAGNLRYLNPEAMRLFPDLQDIGAGHPFLVGVQLIATVLQGEGSFRRELKIDEVYYEQVLHYVAEAEIECLRIYAFDITERKLAEEQLIRNAFYDQLTGLSNRALFMDRLRQAVRRGKHNSMGNSLSQPYLFAVLFLNLNRFKLVNDSLGNRIGDQLLQCFARRLQGCLRPTDTVARLGGDEFAILLEGIEDVSEAIRTADAINQTLTLPFYLDGCEVFMTLSIGIALNTTSNAQPEDLLRDAGIAMYSAKAQGKAYYEVFDAAMHEVAVDRLQMETDLRRAIERQEFQVYYQPIVSLLTGRITGFEALLRWHHPQRGFVSPTEFIPTAEETGLITPIGWWILWEASRQLKIWQQQFPATKPLTMNVNLSCKQFTQPDLLEQIDKILQETKLAIGSLKLEITESVVMENPDLVKDILLELKKRKIHLCIDDFGTGYSSLSRLHNFPISTLKIDRSFVSRIGALGENSEIVQAIVTLAQTLSMDVVAEGIELSEQVSPLIALQCEYGQGYFFSKPVDSNAAEALLMEEWKQRGMNRT